MERSLGSAPLPFTRAKRNMTICCPKCASSEGRSIEAIYCECKTPDSAQRAINAHLSRQSEPPGPRHPVYWVAFASLLTIAAVASVPYSASTSLSLFLCVGLCAWMAREADRYNVDEFPRLVEYWHRAFVCERCGAVFVPAPFTTSDIG